MNRPDYSGQLRYRLNQLTYALEDLERRGSKIARKALERDKAQEELDQRNAKRK